MTIIKIFDCKGKILSDPVFEYKNDLSYAYFYFSIEEATMSIKEIGHDGSSVVMKTGTERAVFAEYRSRISAALRMLKRCQRYSVKGIVCVNPSCESNSFDEVFKFLFTEMIRL